MAAALSSVYQMIWEQSVGAWERGSSAAAISSLGVTELSRRELLVFPVCRTLTEQQQHPIQKEGRGNEELSYAPSRALDSFDNFFVECFFSGSISLPNVQLQ